MLGRLLWRLALQGDILSGVNQVKAIMAKQQPAGRGGNGGEKYETDKLLISTGPHGGRKGKECVCVGVGIIHFLEMQTYILLLVCLIMTKN